MLHLFRFDRAAVAVPPRGNPLGQKYRLGAWKCTMCKALLTFAVMHDLDHGDDCPEWVESAESTLGPIDFRADERGAKQRHGATLEG